MAKVGLQVPDLVEDGKTAIVGPSEVAEFLGVEIRRADHGYRLRPPAKKLAKVEAAMAAMVQIDKCVELRRNIGQVVKVLDSFTVGHAASMAVLDDGGEFMSRLEAAKGRQLRALLVGLLGEKNVEKLCPDHLAVLGVTPFR